jgi:hypothetical protein
VIGFTCVTALPPGCPAIVGAVMLVGLRPAVGSTGTVAMFGDLPSCSETAGPTPIVPVVTVPPAFAVPPALGTAAGDCVEGAVVEPIGCARDDATINAIRPTVTRNTMLLFILEVLQIRDKETELDSDWFRSASNSMQVAGETGIASRDPVHIEGAGAPKLDALPCDSQVCQQRVTGTVGFDRRWPSDPA